MRMMKSLVAGGLIAFCSLVLLAWPQTTPAAEVESKSEASECSSNCVLTVTRGNNVTVLLTLPDGKKEYLLSYEIPADHPDFRKSVREGSEPEVQSHFFGPSASAGHAKDCSAGDGGGYDGWGWELFEVIGSMELPGGTFITSVYIGAGQQVVTIELPNGGGSSSVQDAPMKRDSGCISQN